MESKKENTIRLDVQMAVAIIICLLLSKVVPEFQAMTACISVLLCVQDNMKISRKTGITRLIITAIGGVIGVLVVLIDIAVGNQWIFIILAAIGILLTMHFCKLAKVPYISARIGGVTYILVILTRIGTDRIWYALYRLLSTFYGVVIVLIVAWIFSVIWKKRKYGIKGDYMSKKMYALVGNWGFAPGPKGLSIYQYDSKTAKMDFIENVFPEVSVGNQCIDRERGIVYITNERGNRRGELGGGGYVMAFQINPETGKLNLINEKESLCTEPSFFCLDKTRKYALVAHHCDSGYATTVEKDENGSYSSKTVFDDAGLVLFRINEDGSLGEICDIYVTPGEGADNPHAISHQHSVVSDPTGELFVVCDKGTDKIYTFKIDREKEKIIPLETTEVENGLAARYGVFHPTLPVFYENNEKRNIIYGYQYDVDTGRLELMFEAPLLLNEKEAEEMSRVEPSDILVHPNGRYVYASVRGIEYISVFKADEKGVLTLAQNIKAGGKNPRGLCLAPDANYLFAANMESGNITTFVIGEDGLLTEKENKIEDHCPGNMTIVEL